MQNYLRDLKKNLARKGLPLGYIGVSNNFGRPVAEHPEQIALIKQWIDVAAFMSCPIVRVFAAYVPEDCDDEETLWPPMIEAFKEVAEYGYESGILVGLQNHNHNNVTRDGAAVLRALNADGSSLFHTYLRHWTVCRVSRRKWASRVFHIPATTVMRVLNRQHRTPSMSVRSFYQIDSGVEEWLDYPRVLEILRGVDYNGCLSIVYEGESDPVDSMRKARSYLESLL